MSTKEEMEILFDGVRKLLDHMGVLSKDGICLWCDSELPNHRDDCLYQISASNYLKIQHDYAKKYKIGMYKKSKP